MKRLTKGMYEYNKSIPTSNLFNLRHCQISPKGIKIVHNGGWYNKFGERLGCGDLSTEDFQRISKKLRKDELFIVLTESAASWNFTKRKKFPRGVKLKIEAPGVKYVAEHAMYVIARNQMYVIQRFRISKKSTFKCRELQFNIITHDALKALMTGNTP